MEIIMIILTNIITIIMGLIVSLIMSSRTYLVKKGFPEEYIIARKKFMVKSGLIELFTLLLAQAFITFILFKINGTLQPYYFTNYIFPCAILILIFVSIPLSLSFNKISKHLIEKTCGNVLIDFNFSFLNSIFPLKEEVIFTTLVIVLSIISFDLSDLIVILLLLIVPWMLYINTRYSKNMNRAIYCETYKLALFFIKIYTILHVVIIALLTYGTFLVNNNWKLITGSLCASIVIIKMILTFIRHPKLIRQLEGLEQKIGINS